jgi:hypothetical protein
MKVSASVRCYHCGHVSGEMVAEYGENVARGEFNPREGSDVPAEGAPLRCERCDGPVYLEDVRPVLPMSRIRRIQRMRREVERLRRLGVLKAA